MEDSKEKTIKDRVNETLINKIGMSYDEYEQLDFDEQRKIIAEYHKKHPRKRKAVTVMVGGGDSSLFIKVNKGEKVLTTNGCYTAGETLKDSKIYKKIKRR